MKHQKWIASLGIALALATGARAAHPPAQMLEGAIESYTNLVSLPAGGSGPVQVRDCERCGGRTLRVGPATQYYVGSARVTLQDMNRYLRSGKHLPVAIFYNLGDDSVSRVTAGK